MKRISGTVRWGKFICSLWERAGESEYYVWLGLAVESTGPGWAVSACTVDWCRVDCTRESPTPGPVLPPHRWGHCTALHLRLCAVQTVLTTVYSVHDPYCKQCYRAADPAWAGRRDECMLLSRMTAEIQVWCCQDHSNWHQPTLPNTTYYKKKIKDISFVNRWVTHPPPPPLLLLITATNWWFTPHYVMVN